MSTDASGTAPSRYSMGSARNLVLSFAAIAFLTAAVFFSIPRVTGLNTPAVDVGSVAAPIVASTSLPLAQLSPLPEGWEPVSARYSRADAGVMVWRVGYELPDGSFVSLEQTVDPEGDWWRDQVKDAESAGIADVAGQGWTMWRQSQPSQYLMVQEATSPSGLTTLILGTGEAADVQKAATLISPIQGE